MQPRRPSLGSVKSPSVVTFGLLKKAISLLDYPQTDLGELVDTHLGSYGFEFEDRGSVRTAFVLDWHVVRSVHSSYRTARLDADSNMRDEEVFDDLAFPFDIDAISRGFRQFKELDLELRSGADKTYIVNHLHFRAPIPGDYVWECYSQKPTPIRFILPAVGELTSEVRSASRGRFERLQGFEHRYRERLEKIADVNRYERMVEEKGRKVADLWGRNRRRDRARERGLLPPMTPIQKKIRVYEDLIVKVGVQRAYDEAMESGMYVPKRWRNK